MKVVGFVFVFFTVLITIGCSGGERIAGSKGGSETTNGITASIVTKDGLPAAGTMVRVRRADYVSNPEDNESEISDHFDTVTDTDGTFMVQGIEPGSYCVEVNDTSVNNSGAVLLTCTLGEEDTFDFGNRTLQPHAGIDGKVDLSNNDGQELFVQVLGLERAVSVEEDGTFHIDDLPAGKLDVRVVSRSDNEAQEIRDVVAESGGIVSVQVPENSAWSRYIYIDTLVAEMNTSVVLEGFPFLVRLDQSTFDFSQARSAGEDVRFTKTDGTALPYDIEYWDRGAQLAAVWVRIDTVFGGRSNQAFTMQWGDQDAESLSDNNAVFTSDGGYWHCNDENESVETVSGMIGPAKLFDNTEESLLYDTLNLDGDYTLSCWLKFSDLSAPQRIIYKGYCYTLWYDNVANGLRVEHYSDSQRWRGFTQDGGEAFPVEIDKWYYVVGTYDVDKIRLYINGEVVDSTAVISEPPYSNTTPLELGGRSTVEPFSGILDEVRVENARHSADWIGLCYRNQYQESQP